MLIRTKKGDLKEIIYNDKQLYNYGLNRLTNRDYLRAELLTKMTNLQPDLEMVNKVLDKLTEQGFLDDKRKIKSVFNQYSIKESPNKTKNRLIQKGAHKDIIQEVLYEIDDKNAETYSEFGLEVENSLELLNKKYKTFDFDKKDKMLRFLASRGFKYNDIAKALKLFENPDSI
jgi:SOS response regulatory protein OraA/RecX